MPKTLYPKKSFRERHAYAIENINIAMNWISLLLLVFATGLILGGVL